RPRSPTGRWPCRSPRPSPRPAVGGSRGPENDRAPPAGIPPALLTREELLRRAPGLVPVLRSRAAETEQLRQIPAESVSDLRRSGLIRIGNPRRYGGHDVEVDTAYDVGFELGRGCGSTAWCYSLWTPHNWWLGHFPRQ